jgi:hypothetical protein
VSEHFLAPIQKHSFSIFQICDRIKYPTVVSILGNMLMAVAFLLVGPVPFINR